MQQRHTFTQGWIPGWLSAGCVVFQLMAAAGTARAGEPLRFNRDIRPILSNHCFQCHGPDNTNRKAELRLDIRERALKPAESGETAIVPNKPEASELVRRIRSTDADVLMPPPSANKPLTAAQKKVLEDWVAQGAAYEQHWAFVPPVRLQPPAVKQAAWPRNAIDNFILARLEREGLQPSPEAERMTLLRRLSLDLTGLPPSAADARDFDREMAAAEAEDKQAQSQTAPPGTQASTRATTAGDRVYEKWVDKFLCSPHYGERMAVDWLDLARFADSNGYQVDRDREMYAFRDWVINAFNANQRFDQFTIEQLAGDLLPNATLEQRIATGFHRNHMLNEEGGIIAEEFLNEYCADRVETTSMVWLGLTLNCCRCHEHKFDPFTQRDFYSLYAFFHNVTEGGIGNYGANIRRNAPPFVQLSAPEIETKLASLNRELGEAKKRLAEIDASLAAGQPAWEEKCRQSSVAWLLAGPTSARVAAANVTLDGVHATIPLPALEPGEQVITIEARLPQSHVTALKLEFAAPVAAAGAGESAAKPTVFEIERLKVFPAGGMPDVAQPLGLRPAEVAHSLPVDEVAKVLDDNGKSRARVSINAGGVASTVVELDPALHGKSPVAVRIEVGLLVRERIGPSELRILTTDADADLLTPADILKIVHTDAAKRTPDEAKRIAEFRSAKQPEHRGQSERVAALAKQVDETDLQIPTTLVMAELPQPRPTHILIRGAYDKKGAEVTAGTPESLPGMPADWPRNRLGLARWLVDPANPLTARVTVNRFWQNVFGIGLVRTAEDFGTQGEPPIHPELLDWLATEFVRSGWDVKAFMRLMVTSSTYRQSSRQTPALHERDPENRLLARGPRFRLQAEFLRDQALAAGGLLVAKIGGPSVRPYHPPGLYEQVVSGSSASTYVQGKGDDLYRRSLYTYWKRSVPNPSMLVFDASFRESCTVRRSRTNTPLQALDLMNDPTYVEAARGLAQRMIREGGETTAARITHGFHLLLARSPRPDELAVLTAAYDRALKQFQSDPAAAGELIKVGESVADATLDAPQLAALATVAGALLNLDETVTKE